MAAQKVVVKGSTVSALQLKDLFRQFADGSLNGEHLQAFIEHRNPFESRAIGSFDPATFVGKGWSIVGERKVLHEAWNPKQLVGISALMPSENYIDGNKWKKRLADNPLLGVEAFWACWNNQDQIPEELKSKIILFDGDVLQGPGGFRCSLCLGWDGDRWDWNSYWLDSSRGSGDVSATAN